MATKQTPTTTKQEQTPTPTKPENINRKKIDDAIEAIRADYTGAYVRNVVKIEELDAIRAALAHIAPLTNGGIDAAGGIAANYVININRYHTANKVWQTMASFPVDVHSSKVTPAGDRSPVDAPEWYVRASAADIKAAANGNSNRVATIAIDGKPVMFKGNSSSGNPVKVKISTAKYFKDYVGAAMRDAMFAALPDASIDHDTDVSIKSRRWDIVLVPTKQVSVSVKH